MGVGKDSDEKGPFGLKPFHIEVSNYEIGVKATVSEFRQVLQAGGGEGRFIANAQRLLAQAGGENANLAAGQGRELVIIPNVEHITMPYPDNLKQATIHRFAWEISFSLVVAKKAVARGDVAYTAGCCFRSVACMNQVLFALNEVYLLNEKGAVALAHDFQLSPTNYQQRVESAFTFLSADKASILEAIAILDTIEQQLSQWYGDRRLAL